MPVQARVFRADSSTHDGLKGALPRLLRKVFQGRFAYRKGCGSGRIVTIGTHLGKLELGFGGGTRHSERTQEQRYPHCEGEPPAGLARSRPDV